MNSINILLVDDEAPFVETMINRLSKKNLNISSALSGREALTLLEKTNKIDVVMLDVKMPMMDGNQVLKEIKSKYPLIEVIMLTGHATVESAIEGMKWGAFDYLMKPCDFELIIEKVKEAALKKSRHEEKIIEARLKEITKRRA